MRYQRTKNKLGSDQAWKISDTLTALHFNGSIFSFYDENNIEVRPMSDKLDRGERRATKHEERAIRDFIDQQL